MAGGRAAYASLGCELYGGGADPVLSLFRMVNTTDRQISSIRSIGRCGRWLTMPAEPVLGHDISAVDRMPNCAQQGFQSASGQVWRRAAGESSSHRLGVGVEKPAPAWDAGAQKEPWDDLIRLE